MALSHFPMSSAKLIQLWCFFVGAYVFSLVASTEAQNLTENEIRPYEFTFNIADFQHRSEKKDNDGLITGEYGFITADGIYHETSYATDKSGDFIITNMRHLKITDLKDVEKIFKENPEEKNIIVKALVQSPNGHEIPELEIQETSSFVKADTTTVIPKKIEELEKKLDVARNEMIKILNKKYENIETERSGKQLNLTSDRSRNEIIRDMVNAAKKVIENDNLEKENEEFTNLDELEKIANDLFYRFNYTSTSYSHWETGFHDGEKSGEYNAKFAEGVDTQVKYTSNEFGYQPNITLIPSQQDIDNDNNNKSITITEQRKPYLHWFKK